MTNQSASVGPRDKRDWVKIGTLLVAALTFVSTLTVGLIAQRNAREAAENTRRMAKLAEIRAQLAPLRSFIVEFMVEGVSADLGKFAPTLPLINAQTVVDNYLCVKRIELQNLLEKDAELSAAFKGYCDVAEDIHTKIGADGYLLAEQYLKLRGEKGAGGVTATLRREIDRVCER